MRLTIEQLKNYLGTGLKCKVKHRTISNMEVRNPIFSLDSINQRFKMAQYWTHDPSFCDQFGLTGKGFQSNEFKPLCSRLSDLDKFIPELGFVPIDDFFIRYGGGVSESGKEIWKKDFMDNILYSPIGVIHFDIVQQLFQWHFWPFGDEYFEQGLVIDKLKMTEK